jgi:hypothetical protein
MISEVELTEGDPTPTIYRRLTANLSTLASVLGRGWEQCSEACQRQRIEETSHPYFILHSVEGMDIDLEVGIPLLAPLPRRDALAQNGFLPGGEAAMLTVHGTFEDLLLAGRTLQEWCETHQRQPSGPNYHILAGGDPSAGIWHFEIYLPLA